MAFLGHLGPLQLLRPVGRGPMRPKGARGGYSLAPKASLVQTTIGPTNPLDPNLAKRPFVTTMAIHLLGTPHGISCHIPFMANWPYPSPVANMATSSSYGPFVFWGLHGPSPQSRSHSGNLCPNGYFWSFPSKPGEMVQMAVFGHSGS
ncbi:hypothetical protein O181_116589 [Austropuccinia psidii MF-1]|uniref:Uncharacterized protein n=1 Tax=Austropuccinia psidii MF-1 TaxID=1389203 RepID=A0A9Q3PWP1_9BASI|nr:hypothetical protein [Austropuccinia psidii MF-1]